MLTKKEMGDLYLRLHHCQYVDPHASGNLAEAQARGMDEQLQDVTKLVTAMYERSLKKPAKKGKKR